MEKQLLYDLHKKPHSNVPAMLMNLAALGVAIASLATGWPTAHPLWTIGAIIWLAYFQNAWTLIFHEDAHYSLYEAKWHNVLNGTIIGTFVLIPFTIYRQVHIRHHSKMNMPEDWELWPYCDPKTSLNFRRFFVFVDLLFGLWTGPYIYNRIFFHPDSPLKDKSLRRRITLEFALIVVFWAAILTWVSYTGAWWMLLKIYLIPAWLAGFFQTARKLTEHLGLPAGNPMVGARTVLNSSPLGKLADYINFGISKHGLHHQYPQVPHDNLEKAYDMRVSTDGEFEGAPVFPTYFRAMLDMAPHLLRPSTGVNLGPLVAASGKSEPSEASVN